MSIILTAADNADLTVTATIAGASGTVTLTGVRVDAAMAGESFETLGTRPGNGLLTVTLTKGVWWLQARTSTDLSNLVYLAVTDGLDDLPTLIRAAVLARINALIAAGLLSGIRGVYEQMLPEDTNVTFPNVILHVAGVSEQKKDATSSKDFIGFPTVVQINDRAPTMPPDHKKLPTYESWRYRISRAFDSQPLPGRSEVSLCRVEPMQIIDPKLPEYQHIATGLVVRAYAWVPRGLGV